MCRMSEPTTAVSLNGQISYAFSVRNELSDCRIQTVD